MAAFFLIVKTELFMPENASLKHKRQILRSLIDKIRSKTHASAAETDFNDLWQRAELSFALAGNDLALLQKQFDMIENILSNCDAAQVAYLDCEYTKGGFHGA